jgi:hypothetical protein
LGQLFDHRAFVPGRLSFGTQGAPASSCATPTVSSSRTRSTAKLLSRDEARPINFAKRLLLSKDEALR